MDERTIKHQTRKLHETEQEVAARRKRLADELREARKAGATVQELQKWTGWSRRTIFYMLKEQ